MTLSAIPSQVSVTSFEGEAGLGRMVKVFGVNGADVDVQTAMLDMTHFAISGDLAMNAFFAGHPRGNGVMAREAQLRVDFFLLEVAGLAVSFSIESSMGP